jgi:formamidase
VEGAEPGDALVVELLAYEADSFGTSALIPGFGFLADLFPDPYVVKWVIDGERARSEELPGVVVRGEPFAGVIGVAPSLDLLEEVRQREESLRARGVPVAEAAPEAAIPAAAAAGLRTIPPRALGGNLDVRDLVTGSRIWLPVHVAGALFSIGDIHFAQGDGEVCGTGIETAGAVTVRFELDRSPSFRPRSPVYETPGRAARPCFATTGIAVDEPMDIDAAARAALLEMLDYLVAVRGLDRRAAYALCSAAVDLHIAEAVDVPYPLVSALLPLDVFE